MAFTERKEYKLEIVPPYAVIMCREANIVEKDGEEVGRTYHRHVLNPGDDLTNECEEAKKVAAALWTPQLLADYQAYIASLAAAESAE